jgi:hypothetical protein
MTEYLYNSVVSFPLLPLSKYIVYHHPQQAYSYATADAYFTDVLVNLALSFWFCPSLQYYFSLIRRKVNNFFITLPAFCLGFHNVRLFILWKLYAKRPKLENSHLFIPYKITFIQFTAVFHMWGIFSLFERIKLQMSENKEFKKYLDLRRTIFFFCNPILFALCTSTFSKLCINVYSGM